jgi:hypothetical protein
LTTQLGNFWKLKKNSSVKFDLIFWKKFATFSRPQNWKEKPWLRGLLAECFFFVFCWVANFHIWAASKGQMEIFYHKFPFLKEKNCQLFKENF